MGEEDAGNEGSMVIEENPLYCWRKTQGDPLSVPTPVRKDVYFLEATLLEIIAELYTEATMVDEVTGL